MTNNSNEQNSNRRKVNYKNYKDACKGMGEPEYKRGSKEKAEQIKRWEAEVNLFKQKDNSFTYINPDFESKQGRVKKKKEEEKTMLIDNHTVFLGWGKYKFEKFKNMKEVFLNYIYLSDANSKGRYINEFYENCYLLKANNESDFHQEVTSSKAKTMAWDIFYSECRYVFDQFLKYCKEELETFITYYDKKNRCLDYDACEFARIIAIQELDFKYKDYKTRIEELYNKINEILMDNALKPINRKETIYCVTDEEYHNKECDYLTDIVSLFEIIKFVVRKKIGKHAVALGVPRNMQYDLFPEEYKEALHFIDEYICYYDANTGKKYYSVEDITKTDSDKIIA